MLHMVIKTLAASIVLESATGARAQQGETVKIAWIDPLSGMVAALGASQLKRFQLLAEEFGTKMQRA